VNVRDEPSGKYDLVVGDAFGGLSVPWHLTTEEMVREVRRTLKPGGVYMLNVIDDGPQGLVRAETATLAAVFPHVAAIVPTTGPGGNYVLVGSDRDFRLNDVPFNEGLVATGAALDRFIDGAEVLRDDYAPADQLLTR
jgi:spermidine synthase